MPRRAPAYIGNLIPGLQAAGFSASGALNWLKGATERMSAADLQAAERYQGPLEQGQGGMRRQNFLRIWGATISEQSLRERLSSADPYHVPGADEITRMARPRARGFEYRVDVLARDPTSGSFYFTPTSVVTPQLITHLEAIEQAAGLMHVMQQESERGTPAGEIMLGGAVTSVIERVPELDEELDL